MIDDDSTTDVVLTCTASDWTRRVHSQLLCARSDVLRSILLDMKTACPRLRTINLMKNDCTNEEMDAFIHYLYGCDLELDSFAVKLIPLADYYCIFDLKDECESALCININPDNITTYLLCADTYSLKNLNDACIKTINFDRKILLSDDWKLFEKKNKKLAYDVTKTVACETLRVD